MNTDPVWLLTSKGRPAETAAVIRACQRTGMTHKAILWADRGPKQAEYAAIPLPKNWTLKRPREWGGISAGMEWVMEQYSDACAYGWLADDTYPRTRGWDETLVQQAGNGCISYAKDLWLSEDQESLAALRRGGVLSSGIVWGGDLVRAVGWWALPGTKQAGIDTAWTALAGKLNRCVYVEDVIVEHYNYRTGKRERDQTDSWERKGNRFIEADMRLRDRFITSYEYYETLERISLLCPLRSGFEDAVIREVKDVWRQQQRKRSERVSDNTIMWDNLPLDRRTKHLAAGGIPYNVVDGSVVTIEEKKPKPVLKKKPAVKKPAAKAKKK